MRMMIKVLRCWRQNSGANPGNGFWTRKITHRGQFGATDLALGKSQTPTLIEKRTLKRKRCSGKNETKWFLLFLVYVFSRAGFLFFIVLFQHLMIWVEDLKKCAFHLRGRILQTQKRKKTK